MDQAQVVVLVEKAHLRNFKAECIRRETSVTKELNRLLVAQLEQWIPGYETSHNYVVEVVHGN